jgi:hypothetical protein
MSAHRLPDFELDLGRVTLWVRWGVRSVLALAVLLLAAGTLAYACFDLGAVGRALLGGGG